MMSSVARNSLTYLSVSNPKQCKATIEIMQEPDKLPKRRTRPVSACEECHVRRIRCSMMEDNTTCTHCYKYQRCCAFRILDLCPKLRKQIFPQYHNFISELQHRQASLVKQTLRKKKAGTNASGNAQENEMMSSLQNCQWHCYASPLTLARPGDPNCNFKNGSSRCSPKAKRLNVLDASNKGGGKANTSETRQQMTINQEQKIVELRTFPGESGQSEGGCEGSCTQMSNRSRAPKTSVVYSLEPRASYTSSIAPEPIDEILLSSFNPLPSFLEHLNYSHQ